MTMKSQDPEEHKKTMQMLQSRMKTISAMETHVAEANKKQNRTLQIKKHQLKQELHRLEKEFTEIEQVCKLMNQNITVIGKSLKTKVTKRQLQELQEIVDAQEFEQYIRHDELEKIFDRYGSKHSK